MKKKQIEDQKETEEQGSQTESQANNSYLSVDQKGKGLIFTGPKKRSASPPGILDVPVKKRRTKWIQF